MKKTIVLLLVFVLTLVLFGCGKAVNTNEPVISAESAKKSNVDEVISMIDSIDKIFRETRETANKEGTNSKQAATMVFLEYEDQIRAAVDAYNALSPEEQDLLKENGRIFTISNWESSLAEVEKIREWSGEWVDVLHSANHFILNEDGTYQSDSIEPGRWELQGEKLFLEKGGSYTILNDDGSPLLYRDNALLVKASDYDAYFNEHFVKIEITPENIREYIGVPVAIGFSVNEWGDVGDTPVFAAKSIAFDNGLVLVGWSEDFKYEIIENSLYDSITNTYDEPYPVIYTIWDQVSYDIGNRAMGTLIFVRSDYVMNNYFSENQRIVELYNGVVFKNYAGRWNGITAKYEDYKY